MLGTDAALAVSYREEAKEEARGSNGGEHINAGRECQFVRQSNVERFQIRDSPSVKRFGQIIYIDSGTSRRDKGASLISETSGEPTPVEQQLNYTILGSGNTGRPCGYENRALILIVYAGLMYPPCGCRNLIQPTLVQIRTEAAEGWKTRWLNLSRTQRQSFPSAECREPRSLASPYPPLSPPTRLLFYAMASGSHLTGSISVCCVGISFNPIHK